MQQMKKEMETQRDALADALYKKGLALVDIEEQAPVSELVTKTYGLLLHNENELFSFNIVCNVKPNCIG